MLAAAAFLLPWATLPTSGLPHPHAQWSDAVFALAAMAWMVERVLTRDLLGWASRARLAPFVLAATAYVAWALVSWSFSPRTAESLAHVLGIASLAALAIVVAQMAQDERVRQALARALVAGTGTAGLLALFGVALFAFGVDSPLVGPYGDLEPGPYARARGPSLHPNLLASVGLAAAALVDGTRWPRRLRALLFALLAVTVVATLSRSILTFALAALLRTRLFTRRPVMAALLTAVTASLMVALSVAHVRVSPLRPWEVLRVEGLSPRAEALVTSWRTLVEDPLTGRGPGTSPGRRGSWPFDAHCTPLNVAATMGLPALVALAAIPIALLRRARVANARTEWSALVAIAIDALATDVEDFRHLWLLFGLVAARTRPTSGP